MGDRGTKVALFDGFARVGRALASGRRIELLDVLANGERAVEALAGEVGLSVANTSQHLQVLRRAGLVATRREGTSVHYRLASPQVFELWRALRTLAAARLAEVGSLAAAYLGGRDELEPVTRQELARRLQNGDSLVVLDVRPAAEYAAGHLPGAVSIPVGELRRRLAELPLAPRHRPHPDPSVTLPVQRSPSGLRLGLRANLAQFCLLVGVNALVGGMVGQERTVLSLLATEVFGLAAVSAALTYIVAFGPTKAATNFLAGTLADRHGRKPVLVAGWLVGLPVPLLLIWAPSWAWVAVAVTAYLTGLIAARAGLRPEPFYLGLAYAGLGLGLSALLVRETRGHAQLEAQLADAGRTTGGQLSTREVVVQTSVREPALSACSQAGLVNNLNDGLAWGLLPLLFVRGGLPVGQVGLLAALYPAVWGLGQLLTGPLSDRLGRKPLITGGMLVQAVALAGTAMVYPTLLAAIGDVAHPSWRASAVGVYRLWRDTGFAVVALLAGVVAALTAASGLVVAVRMYETHPSAARA